MQVDAAVHRLQTGITATEEHKSPQGLEITQWVAETTSVPPPPRSLYSLLTSRFNRISSQ